MADNGLRSDDHPRPGKLSAPGDVHVFAGLARAGVETAQSPPQVSPHEDRAAWRHEHLTDGVVLPLVKLTRLDQRVGHAQPVHPHPHRQEPVGGIPHNELGAREAGVASVSLFQQEPHRIWRQADVVMTNQCVGHPIDHLQRLVGRFGKASAGWDPDQVSIGKERSHPLDQTGVLAYLYDQHREVVVVLLGERPQRLVEPRPHATSHDDCHHRGGSQLRSHQGSRA
jgi:hypothetical protein